MTTTRRRRPRLTDAQTERRMLDAALGLLAEHGVAVARASPARAGGPARCVTVAGCRPVRPTPGRSAAVVGGGPAGLIAAEVLAGAGVTVTVYDAMPSVARKLLLAGHGGLNLTHTEDREPFLGRYREAAGHLAPILAQFGPQDLRDWSAGLGQPTFVGSSRRVFPTSFRANPLVRAWQARLAALGVTVATRHRWTGWADDGALRLVGPDGPVEVVADVTVLALGGASWPQLGSDGAWVDVLAARGVQVTPLRPANVGVRVGWSPLFRDRFAGTPVKAVALRVADHPESVPGDLMVTASGLEGGPVYALGAPLRAALDDGGPVTLLVDLRPGRSVAQLVERLARRRPKDSGSSWLRRAIGLDPVSTALLREAHGGTLPTGPATTAALVKAAPVTVTGTMPIDRAISSAGGVAWSQVDERLMLCALPGTFVAGEMLDWEAPTGGYLLQGCFSTGVAAARGALAWLAQADLR